MLIDILVAEIGSTTTVVNAFNNLGTNDPIFLGQGQSPTTVLEGDVNIGLNGAIENLKKNIGIDDLEYKELIATSSAAGGLKMTVHGLVYDMTAKAAKEAALGAGANIHMLTAGRLRRSDVKKIESIDPNIILIAGGVDYGLFNAEVIASLDINVPVIYAGNIENHDDIREIFNDYKKSEYLYIVDNVYPKIDMLNVEPTRKVIQDVFEEHIVHAPGMQLVRELVNGPIIPTPGAVMQASKILKEEIGDLITIDVGGATTDIHSVTEGSDEINRILLSPEPVAKRTVEGDLGMRYSANALLSLVSNYEFKQYFEEDDNCNHDIEQSLKRRASNVDFIPKTKDEEEFDKAIAKICCDVSVSRHVGHIEVVHTPLGDMYYQTGKDLTGIRYVIGTGGVLINNKEAKKILKQVNKKSNKALELRPTNPSILIDKSYIMAAMGLLSQKHPITALKLMKQYLM